MTPEIPLSVHLAKAGSESGHDLFSWATNKTGVEIPLSGSATMFL